MALDDVCSSQQIAVLAGEDCLLGSGSRTILTSREINKYLNLDVSLVKELENHEALQLSSSHAFKQTLPKEGLDQELSKRARYMKIHDLLQQLAQDIVRQECNMSDPPKRIRLWIPEDVLHVLTYHQDLNFLSDNLRILRWDQYPLKSLSIIVFPTNIVELQISGSLESLPNNIGQWKCLIKLDLDDMPGRRNSTKKSGYISNLLLNFLNDAF
ncbi:hypothetical protein POTOM_018738 [Populus tomentosa]|uniref:Uncharacterized protein n=1 Tax=Populus tomentosa TaxID=118781 RepID=A0A8X8D496_POPTO|nr:hypothetical protein POTOM_018738 [Populus tomentosa]